MKIEFTQKEADFIGRITHQEYRLAQTVLAKLQKSFNSIDKKPDKSEDSTNENNT